MTTLTGNTNTMVKRYQALVPVSFQKVLYCTVSFLKGTQNTYHCEVINYQGLSRVLNMTSQRQHLGIARPSGQAPITTIIAQ